MFLFFTRVSYIYYQHKNNICSVVTESLVPTLPTTKQWFNLKQTVHLMAFLNNQFFCLPEPIKMLQAARPLLQKETDFDPTLFEISLEDTTYLRIVCSLSSNDPSRPDREIMYIYTGLRTVNKLSCVSFMYRFTDDVNKELSLDIYFNDHFEIVFYRLFSF